MIYEYNRGTSNNSKKIPPNILLIQLVCDTTESDNFYAFLWISF